MFKCCARGRPIIVEWERDAWHSAGLSLVRLVDTRPADFKRRCGGRHSSLTPSITVLILQTLSKVSGPRGGLTARPPRR
ncbi:hypothetical protein EVAR_24187_1 [Eumeta japonica]|uniref:Uncharacterized protein n=1 Tax=Eumeta variegata TaxID=151549 RepID=A0A4C1W746_EUMVA|nr:hypothetical protein EVAR_24187_1 [Eumeta japonica]